MFSQLELNCCCLCLRCSDWNDTDSLQIHRYEHDDDIWASRANRCLVSAFILFVIFTYFIMLSFFVFFCFLFVYLYLYMYLYLYLYLRRVRVALCLPVRTLALRRCVLYLSILPNVN